MAVATRGPMPKRSAVRRRTNHESDVTKTANISTGVPSPPSPGWQESVKDLWEALGDSAMSQYYTPADWAFAWLTCEILTEALTTRNAQTGMLNASMITSAMSDLARLGVTEGDRRRIRMEIEAEHELDPTIAVLEDYRKTVGA